MAEETGRVIVITGAARKAGICAKTAQVFIENEPDCQVVVIDIRDDEAHEWIDGYDNVSYIHADVAEKAEVVAAKDQVMQRFGKVDVLVCGAGWQAPGHQPLESVPDDIWRRGIDVNLNGVFYCCQAFGSEMLDKGGAIVNISSNSGVNPLFVSASYSPSKAGCIMLTKQLAGEWGPRKVRVNSVAPGQTYTDLNRARIDVPGAREKREAITPVRRIGEPVDQANAIYFLASDKASYINGAILLVDGGITINALLPLMSAF